MPKTPNSATGLIQGAHMEDAIHAERGSRDERMQSDPQAGALRSGYDDTDALWMSQNLVTPEDRPGYKQRWIRVAISGEDDQSNLAKAYAQGWRPRTVESLPEGVRMPSIKHGDQAGVIGVPGMILCERPVAVDLAHKAFLQRKTLTQTRAITGDLEKMEHKDMPLSIDMRTRVARGGRRPPVAADANSET